MVQKCAKLRNFAHISKSLKADSAAPPPQDFPKSLLGFYFKYGFCPQWKILVPWFLLLVAFSLIFNTWWPISQKKIIALFENPAVATGPEFLSTALYTIILIVGVFLICNTMSGIQDLMSGRWQPRVKENISEVLHEYVHRQSMNFFTGRIPGKINSQISYICGGFNLFRDFALIMSIVGTIILNIGLVLAINYKIALTVMFAFVFRLIYSIAMIKPVNNASKKASEASSTLSGHLIDSISGFFIVKLFSGANKEKKYIRPFRNENIKRRIHASFIQRLMWLIPIYLWDLLFGVVLLLLVGLYIKGQMKVSEIAFTLAAYQIIMAGIGQLAQNIPDIMDVVGSSQQSYKELVKPIEIRDIPNAPDLNVKRGAIEVRNVTFYYSGDKLKDGEKLKKRKVLDNFSLSVRAGEKVGLVGASGVGKTTFVNLLMRFYDPASGGIYIDGQDIAKVKQDSLRENIAFVPQEPTMFNRTLRENIRYGKPDASDAEIRRAAKNAEADKFIIDAPNKYDSMVGDRGIKLSGGQRQRVAIARAFLKNAPILIMDEATSALDSETEAAIQKSFEKLSKGRTTIVIAHRLSTLRNMDRIIVIDKGKVIEQGTHVRLLRKRGGVYARLWKMQSGGFLKES